MSKSITKISSVEIADLAADLADLRAIFATSHPDVSLDDLASSTSNTVTADDVRHMFYSAIPAALEELPQHLLEQLDIESQDSGLFLSLPALAAMHVFRLSGTTRDLLVNGVRLSAASCPSDLSPMLPLKEEVCALSEDDHAALQAYLVDAVTQANDPYSSQDSTSEDSIHEDVVSDRVRLMRLKSKLISFATSLSQGESFAEAMPEVFRALEALTISPSSTPIYPSAPDYEHSDVEEQDASPADKHSPSSDEDGGDCDEDDGQAGSDTNDGSDDGDQPEAPSRANIKKSDSFVVV